MASSSTRTRKRDRFEARAPFRAVFNLADPRLYQIAVLTGLLVFGLAGRAFDIPPAHIAATIAGALGAQYLGARFAARRLEAKSALITSLSLLLLLRADGPLVMAAAALLAVGSKFTLRLGGKHVFNPANFGIVTLLIISSEPFAATLGQIGLDGLRGIAWTTPGQWGAALWFCALLAGAGVFITTRAARLDTALVFLGVYAGLLFARAAWLGDPAAIPLNRLQNGALVLFAFFMITDPKTTPDGVRARAAFAALTALAAFLLSHHFYVVDGLFFALAGACALRPLFERVDPARKYQWPTHDPHASVRVPAE